ncbi:MAG: FAD-dependent thymidylate synthase [Gelidibacter sp.]|nr:FAD-dependent thymidylate synthase [Gelidibacter sp.]
MKVKLKAITPDIENTIVEIARVSSSREDKTAQPEKLINYLIRNKHFSPFEHGYITMEIETSKAIGIQLLRHRSFTFQEFSQRYQDVGKLSEDGMFEEIELRKQAVDNRQSSTEVFNPEIIIRNNVESFKLEAENAIYLFLEQAQNLYNSLLEAGVAREQARMILPMATKTRIYMTGSVRSWIHFLGLRDDGHAQKEIQEVAKAIKNILITELPLISNALQWKKN